MRGRRHVIEHAELRARPDRPAAAPESAGHLDDAPQGGLTALFAPVDDQRRIEDVEDIGLIRPLVHGMAEAIEMAPPERLLLAAVVLQGGSRQRQRLLVGIAILSRHITEQLAKARLQLLGPLPRGALAGCVVRGYLGRDDRVSRRGLGPRRTLGQQPIA